MKIKAEFDIPDDIINQSMQKAVDKKVDEIKKDGDFVCVIRCKDCIYFSTDSFFGQTVCNMDTIVTREPDDFCSFAELKESEDKQ